MSCKIWYILRHRSIKTYYNIRCTPEVLGQSTQRNLYQLQKTIIDITSSFENRCIVVAFFNFGVGVLITLLKVILSELFLFCLEMKKTTTRLDKVQTRYVA